MCSPAVAWTDMRGAVRGRGLGCRRYTRVVPRHDTSDVDPAAVARLAATMGVDLGALSLDGLTRFAQLFLAWNQRINLGGDFAAGELVARHFLDSFAASRAIGHGQSVIDVGSGGGLPAVPLAVIRDDLRFQLCEPTAKKVAFLRTAVRELALGGRVGVRSGRIEPGASTGSLADVAMSRATFAPAVWLDLGLGLVRPGGTVLVYATGPENWGTRVPVSDDAYAPGRRLVTFRRAA